MDTVFGQGSTSDLPLSGLTVVEICHSIAGPYAGFILAQLGAEVIKVERPGIGDDARRWGPPDWHDSSACFQALNRNKHSIEVDLKNPREVQQLSKLILDRADIVVQNLKPGTLAETQLSSDYLLAAKPRLIYCNIGSFGRGPAECDPGYDPLMQARGGIMSVTGEADGEPVRVGVSIIDMGSALWASVGILAAAQRLGRTGRGGVVDTSLFETSIAWMTVHVAGFLASGIERQRVGSGNLEIVPHQAFATSDGYVMVAAGNDRLFQRLCDVLDEPELKSDARFRTNPDRVTNRHILVPRLAASITHWSTAEILSSLKAGEVPCAPLQTMGEVIADPQTKALGIIQQAPDKDMQLVGVPLSFDGIRPPYRWSAPKVGAQNDIFMADEMPARVARES